MTEKKVPIQTDSAPAAVGPYSQAIRSKDTLYLSGQIPIDPSTGKLVTGSIKQQAHQVMTNLGAVLSAAGAQFDDLIKVTILLTDLNDFAAVNDVYSSFLSAPYPARACYQVSALPLGASIEIEAVAHT